MWFEVDNEKYTTDKTKETLEMHEKQSIKAVDFGAAFKKTAVDLYWDDLAKLSPDSIAKLQKLLTK